MLYASVYVSTFLPRNFTGWGSEGVNNNSMEFVERFRRLKAFYSLKKNTQRLKTSQLAVTRWTLCFQLRDYMTNKTEARIAWNLTVLACHSAGCDSTLKMIQQNHTVAKVGCFPNSLSLWDIMILFELSKSHFVRVCLCGWSERIGLVLEAVLGISGIILRLEKHVRGQITRIQ